MSPARRTIPYSAALILALALACARPTTTTLPGLLTATLAVQVTDLVTLTFTVTNTSPEPVQIDRTTSQRYDFTILDTRAHTEVWRWSAGRAFMQALESETLAPGASRTYVEQWTPTVHGDLEATAWLVGNEPAMATSTFRVP